MKSSTAPKVYAGGLLGACAIAIVTGLLAAIIAWLAFQSVAITLAVYCGVGLTSLLLTAIARAVTCACAEAASHSIPRPESVAYKIRSGDEQQLGAVSTSWRQRGASMDALAMFLGPTAVGSSNLELVDKLSSSGLCVNITDDLENGLETILQQRNHWDLLVVDIDAFDKDEGLDDLIESLVHVRTSSPHTTTLILSAGFARDDLTASRAVLADASIKSPCTPTRLLEALAQARLNNESWRRRLFDQDERVANG